MIKYVIYRQDYTCAFLTWCLCLIAFDILGRNIRPLYELLKCSLWINYRVPNVKVDDTRSNRYGLEG